MTNVDSVLKSRDITLLTKVHIVKAMVFPVVMYRFESWTIKKAGKNWYFQTVVLKKTLESPLDCKEIQPVHPKGNQFWLFIGRTDAEAEAPILWLPEVKSRLIGKDPDTGKDWRQEEKGTAENEMVGSSLRITESMEMSLNKFWEMVKDREALLHVAVDGVTKSWTRLSDWPTNPYTS